MVGFGRQLRMRQESKKRSPRRSHRLSCCFSARAPSRRNDVSSRISEHATGPLSLHQADPIERNDTGPVVRLKPDTTFKKVLIEGPAEAGRYVLRPDTARLDGIGAGAYSNFLYFPKADPTM